MAPLYGSPNYNMTVGEMPIHHLHIHLLPVQLTIYRICGRLISVLLTSYFIKEWSCTAPGNIKQCFHFEQSTAHLELARFKDEALGKYPHSEAISSLGCRRNSSSGSVSIRQLTELQLMTCSRSVESAGISVNSI